MTKPWRFADLKLVVRRLSTRSLLGTLFLIATAGSVNINGPQHALAASSDPAELYFLPKGNILFESASQKDGTIRAHANNKPAYQGFIQSTPQRLHTLLGSDDLNLLLTTEDLKRYRTIFALQKNGAWDDANTLIRDLKDTRLLGYVYYQRYMHPTKWRSTYRQLSHWMQNYADLPVADTIYTLGQKRQPKHPPSPLKRPLKTRGISGIYGYEGMQNSFDIGAQIHGLNQDAHTRKITAIIKKWVDQRRLKSSLKLLKTAQGRKLSVADRNILKAYIAARYFYLGHLQSAYASAKEASDAMTPYNSQAHWIAGLTAWRLGKTAEAEIFFKRLSQDRRSSSWDRAAGAYWTARTLMQQGKPQDVSKYLTQAATYKTTFYGMLAHGALALQPDFNWSTEKLSADTQKAIARNKKLKRIIGLLQLNLISQAEDEMSTFHPGDDQNLSDAMAALANVGQLARAGLRLSTGIKQRNGDYYMPTLYPIPPWRPDDGFQTDKALIYGFIRQESRFNYQAKSGVGARGLMQLMPATASYIDPNDTDYTKGSARNKLYDPNLNVTLGDRYIQYLLKKDTIQNNLILAIASYNAGPGNINKWRRQINADYDPLLFIESLPSQETRHFVEIILLNFWMYRDRFNQTQYALQALASGDWPSYQAQDNVHTPLWLVRSE